MFKDTPDGLFESQETSNIFSGVIWATACSGSNFNKPELCVTRGVVGDEVAML
jgi:hypothetical protein